MQNASQNNVGLTSAFGSMRVVRSRHRVHVNPSMHRALLERPDEGIQTTSGDIMNKLLPTTIALAFATTAGVAAAQGASDAKKSESTTTTTTTAPATKGDAAKSDMSKGDASKSTTTSTT